MGALCDPFAWSIDALGGLPSSIEVKLVDFPDAGYFATNQQGEIWIRGESVANGYFQNEEETLAAFSDGWFKTGDIGEWDQNGHLKIIDRKKNLVKTLNGEYIALEKVSADAFILRSTDKSSWSPCTVPRQRSRTSAFMPLSRRLIQSRLLCLQVTVTC